MKPLKTKTTKDVFQELQPCMGITSYFTTCSFTLLNDTKQNK